MRNLMLVMVAIVALAGCGMGDHSDMMTNPPANPNNNTADTPPPGGDGDTGGDTPAPPETPAPPPDNPAPTSYVYNFDGGVFPVEFTSSGNALWSLDGSVYAEPPFSARSGLIAANESSCLTLQPAIPTVSIGFHVRVNTPASHGRLEFSINGNLVEQWSGNGNFDEQSSAPRDWSYQAFEHALGTMVYTWCYVKDADQSAGDDAGWIDTVTVSQ